MAHEVVEVSTDDYLEFIDWAQTQIEKLDRDVVMFADPPVEQFNDFTNHEKWPESVVARCSLQDTRDGMIKDPRPEDERTTAWWRANCGIRLDWYEKWQGRQPEELKQHIIVLREEIRRLRRQRDNLTERLKECFEIVVVKEGDFYHAYIDKAQWTMVSGKSRDAVVRECKKIVMARLRQEG